MHEDAFVRAPGVIPLPEDRRIRDSLDLESFCANAGKENWWTREERRIFDARYYSVLPFERGKRWPTD